MLKLCQILHWCQYLVLVYFFFFYCFLFPRFLARYHINLYMKKHRKIICLRISLNSMQDVRTTKWDKMDWCFCIPFLLTLGTQSFLLSHSPSWTHNAFTYIWALTHTHMHKYTAMDASGSTSGFHRCPKKSPHAAKIQDQKQVLLGWRSFNWAILACASYLAVDGWKVSCKFINLCLCI